MWERVVNIAKELRKKREENKDWTWNKEQKNWFRVEKDMEEADEYPVFLEYSRNSMKVV